MTSTLNGYELPFDELLEKDESFNVNHYTIQTISIEMFEVFNNLSKTVFCDLFIRQKNAYNFRRDFAEFHIPRVNTGWYGSNSIRHFERVMC